MLVSDVIQIDAPPDVVWDVTQDVEGWPEWTPTVTSATRLERGAFMLGSSARIKQPGQAAADWVVTAFESGQRFTWETRRPGLRLIATHELVPEGAGTENVLHMEAKGPVAWMLWPILRRTIRRALSEENVGLKQRCEEIATTRGTARGTTRGRGIATKQARA